MIRNILVLMAFLVLCVIVAWLGMSRCRSPKVGDEEVARVIFCSRPQALSRSDLDDRRQGIALAEFQALTALWKDRARCVELLARTMDRGSVEELLRPWDESHSDLVLVVDSQVSSGCDVVVSVRKTGGMSEVTRSELRLLGLVLDQGVGEMNRADIVRAVYKEFQEKLRLERSISQIQDQLEDERLTDRKQVLAEELSRAQDRVKALNVCIAEIGQIVTERRGRTIRLIHEN